MPMVYGTHDTFVRLSGNLLVSNNIFSEDLSKLERLIKRLHINKIIYSRRINGNWKIILQWTDSGLSSFALLTYGFLNALGMKCFPLYAERKILAIRRKGWGSRRGQFNQWHMWHTNRWASIPNWTVMSTTERITQCMFLHSTLCSTSHTQYIFLSLFQVTVSYLSWLNTLSWNGHI